MTMPCWIEVSCSLFPGLDGQAHVPWHTLRETVKAWRQSGLFDTFWFVRKMPGLKLRFHALEEAGALQSHLAAWLQQAERGNELRGYRFTRYEPESHRFGGAAGMELAHRHFDAGSQTVLDYEDLERSDRGGIDRLTYSMANTSDLLLGALGDMAEVWDVWMHLADTVPRYAPSAGSDEAGRWAEALGGWDAMAGRVDEGLSALVEAARAANMRTATALNALNDGGLLGVGSRAWLAAATVFEWNRFGLPNHPNALATSVAFAAGVLAPDARRR